MRLEKQLTPGHVHYIRPRWDIVISDKYEIPMK